MQEKNPLCHQHLEVKETDILSFLFCQEKSKHGVKIAKMDHRTKMVTFPLFIECHRMDRIFISPKFLHLDKSGKKVLGLENVAFFSGGGVNFCLLKI